MSDAHNHLYPHNKERSLPSPTGEIYTVEYIERYVERAAQMGVTEITFSEHLYRFVELADLVGPFWEKASDPTIQENTRLDVEADRMLSFEKFVDVVMEAQEAGLPVRLGLEVDYFPETIDAVIEYLDPYPFDVLLGSIHWIDGWWFDRMHSRFEWERLGARAVYEIYYERLGEMAASGTIDVVTHPDRVKYQGKPFLTEQSDLYARFLQEAQKTNVAIEINTGGLRHPVHEIYPSPTFIRMVEQADLAISFGSDSHQPDQAAWGLDLARAEAVEAGFTHYAWFVGRERQMRPIEAPPTPFSD